MVTTDWKAEYHNLITKAVDVWFKKAARANGLGYIYYREADGNGGWGDVVIAEDMPAGYNLADAQAVRMFEEPRHVQRRILSHNLPIIGA